MIMIHQLAHEDQPVGVDKMYQSIFDEYRSKYINSDIFGTYCMGNKKSCSHFEGDGAIIIPWGRMISEEMYLSVKKIHFIPTLSQLKKGHFPAHIKKLINMWFMEIPFKYLSQIDNEKIPDSLSSLMVTTLIESITKDEELLVNWSGEEFSNLRAISFVFDYIPEGLCSYTKINSRMFPNLEYLKLVVDKRGETLEGVRNFETLKFLELENVNNHDLFSFIRSELVGIRLSQVGGKFNISKIEKLLQLETIWLHEVRTEIDCDIFLNFPKLKEIIIMNSKKVINPDFLLECRNLKNLILVNCGNPLKRELKNEIKRLPIQNIDIDYS